MDFHFVPDTHTTIPKNTTFIISDLSGQCPHCHREVIFQPLNLDDKNNFLESKPNSQAEDAHLLGFTIMSIRRCPSRDCSKVVFLIAYSALEREQYLEPRVVAIYPPSQPKFNKDGLSELLAELYRECITCYDSKCYKASAIMLRRCLEQICEEAGITGKKSLHDKLVELKARIRIHPRLYDVLLDLKELGNDAAHVSLQSFDRIDQEELEIALGIFTKLLDNIYRIDTAADRLKNLKRQPI